MTREELDAIFATFADKVGTLCRMTKSIDEPTKEVDDALLELIDFFAVFVSQTSVLHALLDVLHGDSSHSELAMMIDNAMKDSVESKTFEALVNKGKTGA